MNLQTEIPTYEDTDYLESTRVTPSRYLDAVGSGSAAQSVTQRAASGFTTLSAVMEHHYFHFDRHLRRDNTVKLAALAVHDICVDLVLDEPLSGAWQSVAQGLPEGFTLPLDLLYCDASETLHADAGTKRRSAHGLLADLQLNNVNRAIHSYVGLPLRARSRTQVVKHRTEHALESWLRLDDAVVSKRAVQDALRFFRRIAGGIPLPAAARARSGEVALAWSSTYDYAEARFEGDGRFFMYLRKALADSGELIEDLDAQDPMVPQVVALLQQIRSVEPRTST